METVFDWVSLGIFAGLIVLFLQRSTTDQTEKDAPFYYYLGAGAGCAVGDYLGNHGQDLLGAVVLAATIVFIIACLKPFKFSARS